MRAKDKGGLVLVANKDNGLQITAYRMKSWWWLNFHPMKVWDQLITHHQLVFSFHSQESYKMVQP